MGYTLLVINSGDKSMGMKDYNSYSSAGIVIGNKGQDTQTGINDSYLERFSYGLHGRFTDHVSSYGGDEVKTVAQERFSYGRDGNQGGVGDVMIVKS